MILVISPSKSYQTTKDFNLKPQQPMFYHDAMDLRNALRAWNSQDFQTRMKLSASLTKQVAALYNGGDEPAATPAIAYYSGLVFKQLQVDDYKEKEWIYVQEHVRILSAMYGILRPQDAVLPYRLDFLTKWPENDLYGFWKSRLDRVWGMERVVDLSSNEYSKLLPANRIRIQFLQMNKNGDWKSQSTKTKMARGKMLDWIIRMQIETPEEIQAFALDGYRFDSDQSTDHVWIFKQAITDMQRL